jgi:hypothetical protein
VGHGTDDSNVGVFLQRQNILMVLQKNDTLSIKLACNLLVSLGVDIIPNLIICDTSEGLLKKTHLELGAKNTRYSGIDDLFVKFTSFDELRDDFETPVATTHLSIVTSGKSLQKSIFIREELRATYLKSDALIVLERADVKGLSETSSTTSIGNNVVLITPLFSKDISEEVRV